MVDYQLDLDEYRKFYAELMNQSDEGNDSDNVGSSAAYALEKPHEVISGESAGEVSVSKPTLPLQERDLDLRPKQHIPYKKTQEAKLMAGFCQITLSRLDDCCQRNFNMHQFWHFKVHHFPSQLKFSDGALERSGKAPSENFSLAFRVSSLSFRR